MARLSRPTKRPTILVRRRAKKEAPREASERAAAQRAQREAERAARGHLAVNPSNLARNPSYSTPDFVRRGLYVDRAFNCKACGLPQVWTETQQKWWYESAKSDVWTMAVLCRPCRRRERARRDAARTVHLAGIHKKPRRVI